MNVDWPSLMNLMIASKDIGIILESPVGSDEVRTRSMLEMEQETRSNF